MNRDIRLKAFGERVKGIRKNLGMTMREFAETIGEKTSAGTVSNWEHGKNMPNARRVKRIAELGNVPIEFLETKGIPFTPDVNWELLHRNVLSFYDISNNSDVSKMNAILAMLIEKNKTNNDSMDYTEMKFEIFKIIESLFEV